MQYVDEVRGLNNINDYALPYRFFDPLSAKVTGMPTAIRNLSIASRVWLAAHEFCSPIAVQIICEGTGVLDSGLWRKAVAAASSANPGARLVLRGLLGSCRWIDSGETPPVRVVDGSAWDGMTSEGAEFLNGAFSPHAGPMAEVVLVQGNPPRVVFRAHHALMDGRGCLTWAENIFRALRGEPVVPSHDTVVEDDLLNLSADKPVNLPCRSFTAPTGLAVGIEPGVVWRRMRITGRFPRLLPRMMLLTAQEAWKNGSSNVRIGIPVDLRVRRPGLSSTGNLTNMICLDIYPGDSPNTLFYSILRRLKNEQDGMRTWEERLIPLLPLRLLKRMLRNEAKLSHLRGTYRCTGLISNLGNTPIGAYQGGGFISRSICTLPVCLDSLPFSMAMTGSGNELNLVLSMPNVLANGGRLEELLHRIASGLESTEEFALNK